PAAPPAAAAAAKSDMSFGSRKISPSPAWQETISLPWMYRTISVGVIPETSSKSRRERSLQARLQVLTTSILRSGQRRLSIHQAQLPSGLQQPDRPEDSTATPRRARRRPLQQPSP